MTTREEWLALAARCEAATGPDRELDGAILTALGYTFENVADGHYAWINAKSHIAGVHAPHYTASIDAAVSAVEREFPDAGYGFTRPARGAHGFGTSTADVWSRSMDIRSGWGHAPALALMAALCRAKAEGAT